MHLTPAGTDATQNAFGVLSNSSLGSDGPSLERPPSSV